MRNRASFIICLILLTITWFPAAAMADEKTENKNITLISTHANADGKSKVRKELLEECIVSLPQPVDLDADVSSSSFFLKGINGDNSNNAFVKTYTAVIEINYMLHQKELIVVTTSSVQGQEPVMKVFERNIRRNKRFESNSANGDIYAGRSNRQHYFSTAESAITDARKRALVWLKQQAAVVCPDK